MQQGRTTLSKFVIQQLHERPDAGKLAALLVDLAAAIKAISAMTARGDLWRGSSSSDSSDAMIAPLSAPANSRNASGDEQKLLDIEAHGAIVSHCEWGGLVAGMVSEELAEPHAIPVNYERGPYLLVFDPLDGSSNIDVNVSVGTIFSVLAHDAAHAPTNRDFLRPGQRQLAAGYAIYGPSTMLVLTVGRGTHGFTLDREIGNFVLTHPDLRVPADSREFAINSSNERFWEPPVARYVTECKAGKTGVRERDFNMRWIASLVAEVHRILIRGGVFLYPKDTREPATPGRLRLTYEANPIGFVIEQAGGLASTGRRRILDIAPDDLHQRVPLILGSRDEVVRIERYHLEHDTGADQPFSSPLFNERSLYRAPARA